MSQASGVAAKAPNNQTYFQLGEPRNGIHGDARGRERAILSLPARLWPFHPGFRHLQEVPKVENFTREGLYFTTSLAHYAPGMKVLVTFPFCAEATALRDYLGAVVRVKRLPNDKFGVALRFIF